MRSKLRAPRRRTGVLLTTVEDVPVAKQRVMVGWMATLALAAPAWAQVDEAPPTPPVSEAPAAETPAAETAPSDDSGPASDPTPAPDAAPPLVDPSAPLQRWLQNRNPRVTDEDPGAVAPASPDAPPAAVVTRPAGADGDRSRPSVQLRLRNGQTVEGEVVSESPEGWALKLPSGETRFFDRLDVVSDSGPGKVRPSWAQKAVLLMSLAWPGAGQIVYGAMVQHGQVWERTALVVGSALTAAAVLSAAVLVAGVILGFAAPAVAGPGNLSLGGPLNPITLAGGLGMVLSLLVGVLDAGARAILD